jgi:hypothetical protein
MSNITNQLGFVTNPQFSGGEAVTPLSGSEFAWQNRGYGGIYVGTPGTLVVKTINGNVLTLVSASGFIPGLIGAVSASSTAANIIGFDPIPVALPTTTTSTSTSTTSTSTSTTSTSTSTSTTSTSTTSTSTSTTAAPTTTSTTTAAPTLYSFVVGTSGADGTAGGTACNNTKVGTTITVYSYSSTLALNDIVYSDAGATTLFPAGNFITQGAGFPKWFFSALGGDGVIAQNFGTCTAPATSTTTVAPTTSTTTEAPTTSTTTEAP